MGFRVKTANRWRNGIIPYQFSEEQGKIIADDKVRETVILCMRLWEGDVQSNGGQYFRFRPREEDETPYLSIEGKPDYTDGAIGLTDLKNGTYSVLTIGYQASINAIPHELGHILGLYHENERNLVTSDQAKKNYDKDVGPLLCPMPDSIHAKFKLENLKTAINAGDRVPVGRYDLWSIMHYPPVDNSWEWNCTQKQLTEFLTNNNLVDKFGKNFKGAQVINYPSADEVRKGYWNPSPGDIATLRDLYQDKQ